MLLAVSTNRKDLVARKLKPCGCLTGVGNIHTAVSQDLLKASICMKNLIKTSGHNKRLN